MRTWTETHREGEEVGKIDWSHEMIASCGLDINQLKRMEEHPERFQATTDGGWPRCGIRRVIAFCMYDGWPYWTPHPAIFYAGVLGGEWHSLNSISDIYEDKIEETVA